MDLEEEIKQFPSLVLTDKEIYSLYERWSSLLQKASVHPNRNALMTQLFGKMGIRYPERVFDRLLALQAKDEEINAGAGAELYRSEFTRSHVLTSDKVYLKIGAGRTLREISCYEIACQLGLERFLPLTKVRIFHDIELKRIHREFVWCKVPDDHYDESNILNLLPDQTFPTRLHTFHFEAGTKFCHAVGQVQEEIPNVLQQNFSEKPDEQMQELSSRIRFEDLLPFVCLSVIMCGGDQAIRDTSNSNIVFQQVEGGKYLIPHCIDFEDQPPTYTDIAETNVFLYPSAFCSGLIALPRLYEKLPWELIDSMGEELLPKMEEVEKYTEIYTSKLIEVFPEDEYCHDIEHLGEVRSERNSLPAMTFEQFERDGHFYQKLFSEEQVRSLKEHIRRLCYFFLDYVPKRKKYNEPMSCFDLIEYIFPDYYRDWRMLRRRGYTSFQSGRLIGSLAMDHCVLLGKMRIADHKKEIYY